MDQALFFYLLRRVSCLWVALVAWSPAFAGTPEGTPAFTSLNLERLYADMPAGCRTAALEDGWCTVAGREVAVRRNARGEVDHIGFKLFAQGDANFYLPEVRSFLERVTLELCLTPNLQRLKGRLREYGMACSYNGAAPGEGFFRSFTDGMKAASNASEFRLRMDSLTCTAQWTHPANGVLSIDFPAQYALIAGKDSKELGDALDDALLAWSDTPRTETAPQQPAAADLTPYNGAVYVQRGRTFIIPSISANKYYRKASNGAYGLLYSKGYPCESLANLFIDGAAARQPLMLHITHRKYGYRKQEHHISLPALAAFLGKGFEPYVGFEIAARPEIKAVVFFYNRTFNFVHMLVVNAIEDGVFGEGDALKCNLYAYIPTHNIGNLFGEYQTEKEYEEILWK